MLIRVTYSIKTSIIVNSNYQYRKYYFLKKHFFFASSGNLVKCLIINLKLKSYINHMNIITMTL